MDSTDSSEITRILQEWNEGEEGAKERLMPYVYDELKRQARILMSRERQNHTLQPTGLVHEAFMKISQQSGIDWKNRSHFYGIASHLMRQILVQHARKHSAVKRGGNVVRFSLEDVQVAASERAGSLIALDEALASLAEVNQEQADIVEMRFFGGLTNEEISESLGISVRSVVRKWSAARLWLYLELSRK